MGYLNYDTSKVRFAKRQASGDILRQRPYLLNFVAAVWELGQFLKARQEALSDFANQEGVKFIFTPTRAPHFVKSVKYYLKRVT